MIISTYPQFRVSFATTLLPLDPDGFPAWPLNKVREPGSGFGDTGTTVTGFPAPATNETPITVTCNNYAQDAVPGVDEYRWFLSPRNNAVPGSFHPVTITPITSSGIPPFPLEPLRFGTMVGTLTENVDSDAKIYRTVNGSTTWEEVPGSTPNGFFAVSQPSITHAWAVGRNGTIVATTDGGATWSTQISTTTQHLLGVHFVDNLIGYAVGASNGTILTILKTTNGGVPGPGTWAPVPPVLVSEHIFSVSFYDANHGIVALKDAPMFTSDGGLTWTASAAAGGHLEVEFSPDPHPPALAVAYMTGAQNVYATSDSGLNWSAKAVPGAVDGFGDISVLNDATLWICGANGRIHHSTDFGNNWTEQTTPVTDHLFGIKFIDPFRGWACGLNGVVITTKDGGTTWVQVPGAADGHLIDTDAPRLDMSLLSFSGTIQLVRNAGVLSLYNPYQPISPEMVVSSFKNVHLYVQRLSDQAIQWVGVLDRMVANTG